MNTQQTIQPKENQTREWQGVWIPKHIFENTELDILTKYLYAEISSFSECFLSNQTLSERCGCSEITISRAISKLKELGYVVQTKYDGRKRYLKALVDEPDSSNSGGQTYQNDESLYREYNGDSITLNKSNDVPSVPKLKEDKRNPEIDAVLDAFKVTFGHYPIDPKPRFIAKAFVSNLKKLSAVKEDFNLQDSLQKIFKRYKSEFPDMSTRSLNTVRRHAKVYIEETINFLKTNK